MKTLMMVFLLALIAPAMAAENESKPNFDRYVADDLEVGALSNGKNVIRLVSRSRVTPRQLWISSAYPQGSILVFAGNGSGLQAASVPIDADHGQKLAARITPKNQTWNEPSDYSIRTVRREYRLTEVSTKIHAGTGRLQATVDAGLALGAEDGLTSAQPLQP